MTREEFEEKILPMSPNLYRFAFRYLSSREEAEDAAQDICIKLWNMRGRLSEYKNVEAFAMTMTKNHCLDMLRKRGRNLMEEPGIKESRSSYVNPNREMDNKESYSRVLQLVNDLPENYRLALQLKDIDGLDYEEISEMLDMNINTLRVNLSRARKLLRDKIKNMDYEPTGTANITP